MVRFRVNINIEEVRKKTVTAEQYLTDLDEPFQEKFLVKKQSYSLQNDIIEKLEKVAARFFIISFSASWCKDCAEVVPVLALLAEKTGLEVRIFGGLKKDPLNPKCKWRIPPSPPEVLAFGVDKIPLTLVFDRNGVEVGRIIELPKRFPTLEREMYEIIKSR